MTGSGTLELVRSVFSALLRMLARVLLFGAERLGTERPSGRNAHAVPWHLGDGAQPPQHWLDLVEGRAAIDSPRPVGAPSHPRVLDPSPTEPPRTNGHRSEGTSSQPSVGSPRAQRPPDAVESPAEMAVPRGRAPRVAGTHAVIEEMPALRGSQDPIRTGLPGYEPRSPAEVQELHGLAVSGTRADTGAAPESARVRGPEGLHEPRSMDPTTRPGGSRDGSVFPPPDDRFAAPGLEVAREPSLPFEPVPERRGRASDRPTGQEVEAHRSEPSDDRWPELPPPRSVDVDPMELLRARERSARLEAERTAL